MTTTKLLTGVAVAALLSGAALAQATPADAPLSRDAVKTDDFFPQGATPAQGNAVFTPSANLIASEFQPVPLAQLNGDIVIDAAFEGDDGGASTAEAGPFSGIPATHRVRLTISLDNAQFTTANGASYIAAANSTADGCDFEATPNSGGGVGQTSVSFLSDDNGGNEIQQCDTEDSDAAGSDSGTGEIGEFTIPVQRVSSASDVGVTFTYTQVDALGNPVAGATTISRTLNFAVPGGSWDSSTATPPADHGFGTPAARVATGAGILAAGGLGSISIDWDDQGLNGATPPGAATILDDAGAALTISDLLKDDNEVVITFPNGVGDVDSVDIASSVGGGITCTGPVANAFTCPVTAAQAEAFDGSATDGAITHTVGGGAAAPVTPEGPVTAVFNTSAQTSYVVPGIPQATIANIEHDDGLGTDSPTNDRFEWTRFGSGGTESNIRVQFDDAAEVARVTELRVYIEDGNGITAPAAPGYIVIPEGAVGVGFQRQGATITFNSGALGAAAGATGNANIANIEFVFTEGSPVTALGVGDARRQLVNRSPGSFVATPGLNSDG